MRVWTQIDEMPHSDLYKTTQRWIQNDVLFQEYTCKIKSCKRTTRSRGYFFLCQLYEKEKKYISIFSFRSSFSFKWLINFNFTYFLFSLLITTFSISTSSILFIKQPPSLTVADSNISCGLKKELFIACTSVRMGNFFPVWSQLWDTKLFYKSLLWIENYL